ncbi:MAG: MFS transporter [Planctomycetales bacterium]
MPIFARTIPLADRWLKFDVGQTLTRDGWLLFATRAVRMFAYGLLSVVLVLYLSEVGLTGWQIGWLLSMTLIGDIALSLWITTSADAIGRRRMLLVSALLMAVSGVIFACSGNFWVLLVAATIGIISPSDKEVGPFLSLEQSSLSQLVPAQRRTELFAWYHLVGSFAAAAGSWCGGQLVQSGQRVEAAGPAAYQPVILVYVAAGVLLMLGFAGLTSAIEPEPRAAAESSRPAGRFQLGLHQSRSVVLLLAGLFSLDAFAGGFILQSLMAYWFHLRFGADAATLGRIFLVANLLAGFSGLVAGRLAAKIGLVRTMVVTHLPSNILLLLVPLMPDVNWAVGLFLFRFSISQMDVPTRQALTMSVVAPDERSAAAGVTAVARSLGAAISPLLAALMLSIPALASLPLLLAGSIKIVYDLLLYRAMARQEPWDGSA